VGCVASSGGSSWPDARADKSSAGTRAVSMAALSPRRQGDQRRQTKRSKGSMWMVRVNGAGTPWGVYLEAASPADVTRLEQPFDTVAIGGGGSSNGPSRVWATSAAWSPTMNG
jgi:hypothetical protein